MNMRAKLIMSCYGISFHLWMFEIFRHFHKQVSHAYTYGNLEAREMHKDYILMLTMGGEMN